MYNLLRHIHCLFPRQAGAFESLGVCRARTVGGIVRLPDGTIDYADDFFGRPAYLTVSGQMNAEYYACALSNVYTFGPTFR
jgi:hypothetical protein